MQRLVIVIFLVVCVFDFVDAQNFPHFNHFAFQGVLYNPAVTGSQDAIELDALYRGQWTGIEGQPRTISVSAQSPVNRLNSNLGLFFVYDQLGVEKNNYFQLSYAWRKKTKFANISLGISGGLIQKQIDGSLLRAPDGEYREVFSHNDDYIPEKSVSAISGDLNIGVFLNNEKWYAGVSVNNLIGNGHLFSLSASEVRVRNTRYASVSGGYLLKLSKTFSVQPNVQFLSDFINYQAIYNLTAYYKQKIWVGLAFRGTSSNTKESIIPFLGFNVAKKVKIGYSYEVGISELKNTNSGSHEIFVKYLIDIRKFMQSGKIIYNPRFL